MTHPNWWEQACHHLHHDPFLAPLIDHAGDSKLYSRGDALTTLVRSIVGQQISVQAAASIMLRLEGFLSDICPESVLNASDTQLRHCGLSQAKVRYIKAVAVFCQNEPPWHQTPAEHIKSQLIALPGIGEWTWEMFAIFYLQLPDIFPLRDLGLRKALIQACHLTDPKQIHSQAVTQRIQSWQPWRTAATWFLWRSLDPIVVSY